MRVTVVEIMDDRLADAARTVKEAFQETLNVELTMEQAGAWLKGLPKVAYEGEDVSLAAAIMDALEDPSLHIHIDPNDGRISHEAYMLAVSIMNIAEGKPIHASVYAKQLEAASDDHRYSDVLDIYAECFPWLGAKLDEMGLLDD